jgi:hypothetical protein
MYILIITIDLWFALMVNNRTMRAREFITELRLDIPDQMVAVQVPLSTIQGGQAGAGPGAGSALKNPGRRTDADGRYKWSPPLQQHLDAAKDAIGPSDQAVDAEVETDPDAGLQHSPQPVDATLDDDDQQQKTPAPAALPGSRRPQTQAAGMPQEPVQTRIPTLTRSPGVLG